MLDSFTSYFESVYTRTFDMRKKIDAINLNSAALCKILDENYQETKSIHGKVSSLIKKSINITTLSRGPLRECSEFKQILVKQNDSDFKPHFDTINNFLLENRVYFNYAANTIILFSKEKRALLKLEYSLTTMQFTHLIFPGIRFEFDTSSSSVALKYNLQQWFSMEEKSALKN